MYKILTSVVLSGVLLAGCAETAGEVEDQNAVEGAEVEAEEEVENSIFVDDVQTSFTFTPTEAPNLTEEEKRIGRDLSLYVSEKSTVVPEEEPSETPTYLSDREYVEMASEDYPNHSAEELYDIYTRYYDDIFYGDIGGDFVEGIEWLRLEHEIISSNVDLRDVTSKGGTLEFANNGTVYKRSGRYAGEDGSEIKIDMWVGLDFDTAEATLLRLTADGEEAFEYDPEDIDFDYSHLQTITGMIEVSN